MCYHIWWGGSSYWLWLIVTLQWYHLNWGTCDSFRISMCLGLDSYIADLEIRIWVPVVYLGYVPMLSEWRSERGSELYVIKPVTTTRNWRSISLWEFWEAVGNVPPSYPIWGSRRLGIIWHIPRLSWLGKVPGVRMLLDVQLACMLKVR